MDPDQSLLHKSNIYNSSLFISHILILILKRVSRLINYQSHIYINHLVFNLSQNLIKFWELLFEYLELSSITSFFNYSMKFILHNIHIPYKRINFIFILLKLCPKNLISSEHYSVNLIIDIVNLCLNFAKLELIHVILLNFDKRIVSFVDWILWWCLIIFN